MIKRISIEQLKPGMFIHDLNCGWMDHPFAFNAFKVENEKIIEKIAAAGIREFYIDTAKGLDVADAQTHDEYHAQLHEEFTALAENHIPAALPATLQEEITQAKAIHAEAHSVVQNLMSDIRMGKQIQVSQTTPVVERITDSIFRNKDAFVSLSRIKKKDQYTFQHSVSVCALLVSFCRSLEYEHEVILEAGLGGLLHDVGKMKVPDHILNKPGPLVESELAIMRTHAAAGRDLLRNTPGVPDTAIVITAQHHERYDGTGYPDKIKHDEISKLGQMAAIVDVYDALTSERVYHKGMEPTAALKKLFEWSKFHFDPVLVQRFICLIGIYPVGSLVRLESGVLGVVLFPGSDNLLHPVVRVVFDIKNEHSVEPYDLDLAALEGNRIVQHESPHLWGIDPFHYI